MQFIQYLHNPLKVFYGQSMYTFIFNYIFDLVTALNNLFFNLKNILNSKYLDVFNAHNTSKSYLLKNIMAIHTTIDVYYCN